MSNLKPYPKYKPSGVEWLGDVPEHWGTKRLKYITSCNDDVLGNRTHAEDKIQYVDIGNVSQGKIEHVEDMTFGSAPSRARRVVRNGDIIVSTVRTYLRAMAIMHNPPKNMIVSTGFAVIRAQKVNRHFLAFALQSNSFIEWVVAESKGVSYPAINAKDIIRFTSAFPSVDEQSAIATFLDRETGRIDALVEEKTRFIELLKEKRQALITQAVTKGLDPNVTMKDSGVEWIGDVPEHWHVKKIAHLTPVQRGASPRPIDDPRYFDNNGEYGWVRIQDVTRSKGPLISTMETLSKLGASKSVKMNPGTLFLSIAATVGVPCITKIKCCIHDGFVYFPMLQIEPMWLFRIFEARKCFVGLGKMGTQLNLNTDTVGGISIPVPPPTEIDSILSNLNRQLMRLDSLLSLTMKSIDILKERRSALITAAVTGKIDVRETK